MDVKNNRWVYLNDLQSQAKIFNLATEEIRVIYPASVKDKGPIGLRFAVLEEQSSGIFFETGEILPATPQLLAEAEENYTHGNNWNYDWPHPYTELADNAEEERLLRERLTQMMAPHAFDFEIIGLQKRRLWYYSDGDYKSQAKFVSMIPAPDGNPYRWDGSLKRKYRGTWSSEDRDKKRPKPPEMAEYGYGARPLLYMGDAYVVRFKLDGQIPAFEHCRVYVQPDGTFICSDWCQRHDLLSYRSGGINLQVGNYTFDGWVSGSCVGNAMAKRVFTPKNAKITTEKVADALKKPGAVYEIPSLDKALKNADAKLAAEKKVEVNYLEGVVSQVLKANPKFTDEQIADAVVKYYQKAILTSQFVDARGASVLVPKQLFDQMWYHVAAKTKLQLKEFFVPELGAYRVELRPYAGCTSNASWCIPLGHHTHLQNEQFVFDEVATRSRALPLIEQAKIKQLAGIEAEPITAEIFEQADLVAKDHFRRVTERAVLAALQRAKLASIPVLETVVSEVPVRMEAAFEGKGVRVNWGEHYVFYVRPDTDAAGHLSYVTSNEEPLESATKFDPVYPDAPLATAVKLWFEDHLPKFHAEVTGTPVEGNTFTFIHEGRLWRAEGFSGHRAKISRWTKGEFADEQMVVKRSNGHVYSIDDEGRTSVLKDTELRNAAGVFYSMGYKHFPVMKKEEVVAV